MASLMHKILSTIDRVRSFSQRLREFLNDVTRCGLQKQFESVCENIGLIAFLLQTEPKYEQVAWLKTKMFRVKKKKADRQPPELAF